MALKINVVCFAKSEGREANIYGRVLEQNIFLWIAVFVAYAHVVNPNGIKTLLANGIGEFPAKCNPGFNNGPRSLPKNPPDCPVLCNW